MSQDESKGQSPDQEIETLKNELIRVRQQCMQAQKRLLVGILAGGVAHNFNNLLMGIQGNAGLIRMTLEPAHPNMKKISRILEMVDEGSAIVRELIGFAKSDRTALERIDVNPLLKQTIAMFSRTRKELTIMGDYAPELWRVNADRGQMVQIFLNLLLNASQAMPNAGEILVSTRNRCLGPEDMVDDGKCIGDHVMVSIQDSGNGMTDDVRARAFDPFFTTLFPGKGIGLGLSVCREILAGWNGFAVVGETSSSGTTMNVFIPAAGDAAPDA